MLFYPPTSAGFLNSWSQYRQLYTLLEQWAGYGLTSQVRARQEQNFLVWKQRVCWVLLHDSAPLSGDIHLNLRPRHAQQMPSDSVQDTAILSEQVVGSKPFNPHLVSMVLTKVASCHCGAAALISGSSISCTLVLHGCAVVVETLVLTCRSSLPMIH